MIYVVLWMINEIELESNLRLRLILSFSKEGLNKPDVLNQPGPLSHGRTARSAGSAVLQ
jgi:hypothetical protein